MADDDEGKVRRNLVWLSSFVVGWWLFGVDVSDILKRLVGVANVEHPTRIWPILLILLYYTFARFWASPQANEARKSLFDFRRSVFHERLMSMLNQDIPKLSAISEINTRYISKEGFKKILQEVDFGPATETLEFRFNGINPNGVFRSRGLVALTANKIYQRKEGDASVASHTLEVPYQLPAWRHRAFALLTFMKLAFWDNETTYFVFPTLVWFAAVLITSFNLWATF